MREKENDGTFAAQPRTLAAMSALPISIDFESIKSRPDSLRRKKIVGWKTARIDIGRTDDSGGKTRAPFSQQLTRQACSGFTSQLEDMDEG